MHVEVPRWYYWKFCNLYVHFRGFRNRFLDNNYSGANVQSSRQYL